MRAMDAWDVGAYRAYLRVLARRGRRFVPAMFAQLSAGSPYGDGQRMARR